MISIKGSGLINQGPGLHSQSPGVPWSRESGLHGGCSRASFIKGFQSEC